MCTFSWVPMCKTKSKHKQIHTQAQVNHIESAVFFSFFIAADSYERSWCIQNEDRLCLTRVRAYLFNIYFFFNTFRE